MDPKEQALASYRTSRIAAGTFDENDVFALLILLREHSGEGSAIREFGHFVAHRERDRGAFLSFVNAHCGGIESRPESNAFPASPKDVLQGILAFPSLFTEEEIFTSLNDTLELVGLTGLPPERSGQVVMCIISLLQCARLANRDGGISGKLLLAFNNDIVVLLAKLTLVSGKQVLLPLVRTRNESYCEFNPPDQQTIMSMPNVCVMVEQVGGRLCFRSL